MENVCPPGRLPVLRDWTVLTEALTDDEQMERRGRAGNLNLALLVLCCLLRTAQGAAAEEALASRKRQVGAGRPCRRRAHGRARDTRRVEGHVLAVAASEHTLVWL